VQQLGAIEAGKPFAQLQKANMAVATMDEIVRQKDGTPIKEAVLSSIKHQVGQALNAIGDHIHEVPDKSARLEALSSHYLSMTQQQRQSTIVLTPANDDRQVVNHAIREGLIAKGEIDEKGKAAQILSKKSLTFAEKLNTNSYQKGDVLQFNYIPKQVQQQLVDDDGQSISGITRNTYYQITDIDKESDIIKFSSKDGKIYSTKLSLEEGKWLKGMQLYQVDDRQIAKGDVIRWTRNDKDRSLYNAETATVLSVRGRSAKVRLANGDTLKTDLTAQQNQHWEHAYASTVHAAQGATADTVIAHDESFRRHLTNQKAFYVTLSRAREEAHLYIDNAKEYQSQLESNLGEKTSALEHLNGLSSSKTPPQNHIKDEKNITENLADGVKNSSHKDGIRRENIESDISQPTVKNRQHNSQSNGIITENNYYDIDKINGALHSNCREVVTQLLGEPNQKLSRQGVLRYGNKGSFSVTIAGEKSGLWHDFESGKGGNLLQLLMQERGLSFTEALQESAQLTGIEAQETPINHTQNDSKKDKDVIDFGKPTPSEEDRNAMGYAQKIWDKGQAVDGTLADKYLTEVRGISPQQWSKSLRFLPECWHGPEGKNYPALLVKASNHEGELQAIQRIYLNEQTAEKANIMPNKMTIGRMKYGAAVCVQENENANKIYIVEGPETALSIAQADKNATVLAALSISNIKNIEFNESQNIVICADNDGGIDASKAALTSTVEALERQGHHVEVVVPMEAKTDFNDVLKTDGIDAVRDILNGKNIDHQELLTGDLPAREVGELDDSVAEVNPKQQENDNDSSIPPAQYEVDFDTNNAQSIIDRSDPIAEKLTGDQLQHDDKTTSNDSINHEEMGTKSSSKWLETMMAEAKHHLENREEKSPFDETLAEITSHENAISDSENKVKRDEESRQTNEGFVAEKEPGHTELPTEDLARSMPEKSNSDLNELIHDKLEI